MRPSLIAMLAAAGLAWTGVASAQPGPGAASDAPAGAAAQAALEPAPQAAAQAASQASPQDAPRQASSLPQSLAPASLPPNRTLASTTGTVASASAPDTPMSGVQSNKPTKKRLSWEQRFAQANTTGDGRLTLEQAKAGYLTVARHFKDIDLDGKGWVTAEDIRAWHKAQRAARHAPKAAADSGAAEALRPQPAYHRSFPKSQQGTNADPAPNPVDGVKSEDPS